MGNTFWSRSQECIDERNAMQANYLAGNADYYYEETEFYHGMEVLEENWDTYNLTDEVGGLDFYAWLALETERGWEEGCLDRSEFDNFVDSIPDWDDLIYDDETSMENQCHGDFSDYAQTYTNWIHEQGWAHLYRARNAMLVEMENNDILGWCGDAPSYATWDITELEAAVDAVGEPGSASYGVEEELYGFQLAAEEYITYEDDEDWV